MFDQIKARIQRTKRPDVQVISIYFTSEELLIGFPSITRGWGYPKYNLPDDKLALQLPDEDKELEKFIMDLFSLCKIDPEIQHSDVEQKHPFSPYIEQGWQSAVKKLGLIQIEKCSGTGYQVKPMARDTCREGKGSFYKLASIPVSGNFSAGGLAAVFREAMQTVREG